MKAHITCKIISQGNLPPVKNRGIIYYTSENKRRYVVNEKVSGSGEYILPIENLQGNIKYYIKAFAENNTGVGFSKTITFEIMISN